MGNIFMLHKKYWLEYWIWDTDLTGAGQFLRSVRRDEFGPTEMQFDRKTEVKVKSSMARSLPVKNLLPQNVGSIINYLQ